MGEVLCVTKGDKKKLTQWVSAKPDRYVVWVGQESESSHPRIYSTADHELSFQQIAAQLLYLPFVYEDPSHPALQRLARIQTELHYRASDFIDQGVKLLTNYQSNLQNPTKLARDCFGRFNDTPAIICGAGPSLKGIIPFLKEHRDRFLIVGCGAGMQALIAAGVEPHLAVHVDPDPSHQFSKTSIPFFYQLRTSHKVASQMKGPRFLMAGSGEFPLEQWIEQKLGLEPSSDGGWTATTRAAALISAFGCPKIFFAGIDFSATTTPYAEGVASPQEGTLMKITLPSGETVQTRSDWLLAAEWLSEWVANHPEITWGLASNANPLMPSIPAVDLHTHIGSHNISQLVGEIFFSCMESSGKEIWKEIGAHFKKCRALVDQFLTHFQKIFPQPPTSDETCMKILQQLNEQEVVQRTIDPIWSHWEVVLKRQPDNNPDALIVHRILLIKSLSDRFYA